MQRIKNILNLTWVKISGVALCGLVAFQTLELPAFAEGEMTAVTTAFTGLKADIITVLGAVAGLAVGVMAVFLGWKFGKKIFNSVAK